MNALAAASPWYCVALRRASAWLADTARWLEATGVGDAVPSSREAAAALDYVQRCSAAEERLSEMRTRYY